MDLTSKKVTSNMLWRFLERVGAQGVTVVVSLVLANLLSPEIYGTVALVMVFTTILQVFVDSGFGAALIQKKDADSLDFSTVFFFNLGSCIVLYVILFFAAPLIASFYNNDKLTEYLRVLGLLLIISGFKNIQNAYVSRNLLFKKYFFATLGGTLTAAVVGIWMAVNGYGVWAVIVQNLVNQTIDTIILWILVPLDIRFQFSWKRWKTLFSFGWKLLISAFLDTLWNQLRSLIIGKKYTKEELAYYNKGNEYPQYAINAITSSIDSVLLPVMSQAQEDPQKVKELTRQSIQITSFVLWPMMLGLAAVATPFVSFILTDKWLPMVPYLQIFCIVYAFYPIHSANLNAIKAMGRSDYYMILEIIKKAVALLIILVSMQFGVIWMALSTIISSVASQIINSWPNKKLLGYSYLEQLKDILPYIALSLAMAGCVYLINFLPLASWLKLLIQVPLGVALYVGGAKLFKMKTFDLCLNLVKNLLSKGKEVTK